MWVIPGRLGLAAGVLGAAVSSPVPVDAPVQSSGRQLYPSSIATDGTDFLVGWVDNSTYLGNSRAHVARVTADGGVLDPAGVTLGAFTQLSVTFDETGYAIEAATAYTGETPTGLGTLSPAGVLTFTAPIDAGFPISSDLNLAGAGALDLLTWSDDLPDGSVFAARVVAGQVEDSQPLQVATAIGTRTCPVAGFDGQRFWLVWLDGRDGGEDVYGTSVEPDGTVDVPGGGALTQVTESTRSCPVISCDGASSCLVVWEETVNGASVVGRWILAGSLAPNQVDIQDAGGLSSAAVVVNDGGGLMYWGSGGAYIDRNLDVLQLLPGLGIVRAAANPTTQLLVGTSYNTAEDQLWGVFTLPDGADAGVPFTIQAPYNIEFGARVACGASRCLVAWGDDRLGEENLVWSDQFVVPVAMDGTPLDPVAHNVIPANINGLAVAFPPPLAASATGYLLAGVAFVGPNDVDFILLDTDGGLVGTAGTLSTTGNVFDDVLAASNGTDYLVVWAGPTGALGARVISDGGVADPTPLIVSSTGFPSWVVSNGHSYVVGLINFQTDGGVAFGAVQVGSDGTLGLPPPPLAQAIALGAQPVFQGNGYALLWESDAGEMAWELLDADGGTITAGPFTWPGGTSATVVPAPYGILALWETIQGDQSVTFGQGLVIDGGTTDPAPVVLFADPYSPVSSLFLGVPAYALQSGGALLAESVFETAQDTPRVFTRSLRLDAPLGAACVHGLECASGVCDSSVCCATASACTRDSGGVLPDAGQPGPDGGQNGGEGDAGGRDGGLAGPAVSLSIGCGCGTAAGVPLALFVLLLAVRGARGWNSAKR